MTITWLTMAPSEETIVEYGEKDAPILDSKVYGTMKLFKDYCGSEHRKMYVHRVKLQKLQPGGSYSKC